MADNRYKHGVYQGNYQTGHQKARQQREAMAFDHPATYGWTLAYFHPQYDIAVFTKGHYKLMAHPDGLGWLIEDTRLTDWARLDTRHIRVISGELFAELEGVTE